MSIETAILDALVHAPRVRALDVVRLQDVSLHDGSLTEANARMLLEIEAAPSDKHPSWKGFFIDAMTQYVVDTVEPCGYLTTDKATWLLRHTAPTGRILTPVMFEMLTAVIAQARWIPERFVAALLDEVCCAVQYGDGPLRADADLAPGQIGAFDAEVVRRLLYAAGAYDGRSLSRIEVEGLLAIEIAGSAMQAPASWTDVFVCGLTDGILAASGFVGPVREVILGRRAADVGSPRAVRAQVDAYRRARGEDQAIAALERQRHAIVTGDEIMPCTAEWLAYALARDRRETAGFAGLDIAIAELGDALSPELAQIVPRRRDDLAA
jgi:hypothetical protein